GFNHARAIALAEGEEFIADDLDAGLRLDLVLENLVCGPGEDIIRPDQEEPLFAELLHEELGRGNELLIRGGPEVDDPRRLFEPLILHGIEEQAVVPFDYGFDRLAARRRP